MRPVISAFLALIGLAACGKDSSDPSQSAPPNIAGNWTYTTSNLTGSGLTCSSSGTTMTITQQDATFTGTYSGGMLTCSAVGGSASQPITGGTVVNGSLSSTTVAFDMDTPDWHNSGTISGTMMSGTTRIVATSGTTTFTLNGSFTASRQ
jgi:hypothetical protein